MFESCILFESYLYLSLLSLVTTRHFSSRYFSITALNERQRKRTSTKPMKLQLFFCDTGRKTTMKQTVNFEETRLNQRWSMRKTIKGALPSDDTTFQVVELDELPKATGVVILCGLGVAKGLFKT